MAKGKATPPPKPTAASKPAPALPAAPPALPSGPPPENIPISALSDDQIKEVDARIKALGITEGQNVVKFIEACGMVPTSDGQLKNVDQTEDVINHGLSPDARCPSPKAPKDNGQSR